MMMNRNSSKDSLIGIGARNLHSNGIRNAPPVAGLLSHRRVMSFTSTTEDFNNSNSNNVDFLSRNRRSLSVASSDESDLQVRLGRLSVGSTKTAKNVLDDLLSSNEGGKHDYDWLLTPPGTPLLPCSSDGKESESQPRSTSVTPGRSSSVRSGSAIKNSRLSASQSESIHPSNSKPARSSSATTNRNPNNILNTSSASVSSYRRPSSPSNRSSSTARPSTPSRTRPSTTTTTTARSSSTTRPSQNARPSTPTSPVIRPPSSRPSTPTRRSPTPPSSVRALSSNGRSVGTISRPSSPSPRVRPPPQPIIPPDFPHETPPNLRTTLPERPLSAGRSRPGAAMATNSAIMARRQSSPIVTRGRHTVTEPPPSRGQSHVPESLTKKPIKMSNSEGVTGTGFGRNISKKSLDMAIKHMDIRNGGIRPSTLFPQSIRSGNPRMQGGRGSSKNGILNNNITSYSSKIIKVDMYENSRYDAIILKEDLNNTTWLHSLHNVEEKSDELGQLFDNGFETIPEPFAPL